MKTVILALVAVFSLTLFSFTPHDSNPIKRLKNGNYQLPQNFASIISKADLQKLESMTIKGAAESTVILTKRDIQGAKCGQMIDNTSGHAVFRVSPAKDGQTAGLQQQVDRILKKYL